MIALDQHTMAIVVKTAARKFADDFAAELIEAAENIEDSSSTDPYVCERAVAYRGIAKLARHAARRP